MRCRSDMRPLCQDSQQSQQIAFLLCRTLKVLLGKAAFGGVRMAILSQRAEMPFRTRQTAFAVIPFTSVGSFWG